MNDPVLARLQEKYGCAVWKAKDGSYWPLVLMSNRRLAGLIVFVDNVITRYRNTSDRAAISYAIEYEDRDWLPGYETLFYDSLEDDNAYQELLEWQRLFNAEQARRRERS